MLITLIIDCINLSFVKNLKSINIAKLVWTVFYTFKNANVNYMEFYKEEQ